MAENLMKVPTKGILKNSTSFEGSSSTKGCTPRGAKWDEMNILATHHPPDKDYGHMKIEEPKTPFSYQGEDSGDEGETHDLDSKLLTERLIADSQKLTPQEPDELEDSEDDESGDDDDPETKAKKRSFEHKRKAHYNEFMAVKLARQLMQNDEEDVESTEEERVETIASNNDPEAEKPIELSENDAEGMDVNDSSLPESESNVCKDL